VLYTFGFFIVGDVYVGCYFIIEMKVVDVKVVEVVVRDMCGRLFANLVIEDYEIVVVVVV
jgi:phosphoribosylformylglycinamidine synthase, purS protein